MQKINETLQLVYRIDSDVKKGKYEIEKGECRSYAQDTYVEAAILVFRQYGYNFEKSYNIDANPESGRLIPIEDYEQHITS